MDNIDPKLLARLNSMPHIKVTIIAPIQHLYDMRCRGERLPHPGDSGVVSGLFNQNLVARDLTDQERIFLKDILEVLFISSTVSLSLTSLHRTALSTTSWKMDPIFGFGAGTLARWK